MRSNGFFLSVGFGFFFGAAALYLLWLIAVPRGGTQPLEDQNYKTKVAQERPDVKSDVAERLRERPDVKSDVAERLRRQRAAFSRKLDKTLQEFHRLQCNVTTSIAATGGWCNNAVDTAHMTDIPLSNGLKSVIAGKSVGSFGEGRGEYKKLLQPHVERYDGYDGAPFIDQKTNGSVQHLDLSIAQYGLPIYDWLISLEVIEHIPAEFEEIVLDNIIRHARHSIILSWAVPGQGGYYHVNLKPIAYVIAKMNELCFEHDSVTSKRLRDVSTFGWFRNNINVFHRKKVAACAIDETEG